MVSYTRRWFERILSTPTWPRLWTHKSGQVDLDLPVSLMNGTNAKVKEEEEKVYEIRNVAENYH